MQSLAEDNTCTYLRTPAGIFTELTLPVEEIFNGHENDTLNTAKIVLNQLNSKVDSEYALDNAERLLLVQKDSLFSFFEEGKLYEKENSTTTRGLSFHQAFCRQAIVVQQPTFMSSTTFRPSLHLCTN